MSNFISTGALTRPENTTTLTITIQNTTSNLQFQTIYIYDLDSGSSVLVLQKNYILAPNSTVSVDYKLLNTDYSDYVDITTYEIVYGPTTPGVVVTFSNS